MKSRVTFLLIALFAMAGKAMATDYDWNGTSVSTENWANTIYYSTASAMEGGALKVSLTAFEGAQIQVCVSNPWGALSSGNCQDAVTGDCFFVFNATEAANINNSKLAIQGKNITITSVSILSQSEVATLSSASIELFTTSTTISGWNRAEIKNDFGNNALKSVQVGDKIKATITAAEDGSYTIQERVYYRTLASGSTTSSTNEITYTVTEETMGIIRKNGVDFTGGGTYTVTKVELISSPVGYKSPAKYLYGTVWDSDQDSYTENESVDKLVVYKPIIAGKNSICLPFETTAEAVAGTGAVAYAFTNATANELTFNKVETMVANTPYLLISTEAMSLISVYNVTLKTKSPFTVAPVTDYSMIGNYTHDFNMYNLWGINSNGNLQIGGSGAKLSAFSAYFTGSFSAYAPVKALFMDDKTGINKVEDSWADGAVYNLAGQRVTQPAQGIYIINGKKVFIK